MSDNYTVESNVKRYALACSSQNRAGKFTRVSGEFLTNIEADIDSLIRQIESKVREPLNPAPQGVEELRLITGHALDKCRDRLEAALRKIIQNRVQGTPTVGCTL